MDPKDFGWSEDQQVTVTNPTSEPFRFKVHNKDYEIGAGRTVKMPGYIAWVAVYNLAVRQAQTNDEFDRWNEEGFRKTYYEKFVVGYDSLIQEVEDEPAVDFEDVTTDKKDEEPTAPAPVPVPAATSSTPASDTPPAPAERPVPNTSTSRTTSVNRRAQSTAA